MTLVLVHGVPETAEIWDPLRAELGRDDVVALRLPGFGCPLPEGFAATKEAYVDWLIGELDALGPVDLVGHDWGGGFVARLVSLRPDLVRTWVTDAAALADPSYEWHDTAKLFQTPGVGEEVVGGLAVAGKEALARMFAGQGVPADRTAGLTGANRTMARAILALYRSAVTVGAEWGPDFADVPKPGLALLPTEDGYLPGANTRAGAAVAGARVVELSGRGHWWMLEDPVQAATVLKEFWG